MPPQNKKITPKGITAPQETIIPREIIIPKEQTILTEKEKRQARRAERQQAERERITKATEAEARSYGVGIPTKEVAPVGVPVAERVQAIQREPLPENFHRLPKADQDRILAEQGKKAILPYTSEILQALPKAEAEEAELPVIDKARQERLMKMQKWGKLRDVVYGIGRGLQRRGVETKDLPSYRIEQQRLEPYKRYREASEKNKALRNQMRYQNALANRQFIISRIAKEEDPGQRDMLNAKLRLMDEQVRSSQQARKTTGGKDYRPYQAVENEDGSTSYIHNPKVSKQSSIPFSIAMDNFNLPALKKWMGENDYEKETSIVQDMIDGTKKIEGYDTRALESASKAFLKAQGWKLSPGGNVWTRPAQAEQTTTSAPLRSEGGVQVGKSPFQMALEELKQ